MRHIFLLFTALLFCISSFAQEDKLTNEDLINSVVGGVWISNNEKNSDSADDFRTFYMSFENWGDASSAVGNIYGISNSGDTTQLIQVWNFVDKANNNIFLIQRDAWGAKSIGTINPYEGKHLDIQFKTTTADGRSYFTRDIHYLESGNKMKAVTYHKTNNEDEWEEAGTSVWIR